MIKLRPRRMVLIAGGGFFAALFFAMFFVPAASAATLYLSPASGDYLVGHTFTMEVYVSSPDQAMNAAQGALTFPIDKLEVISISKSSSVINLWVQDPAFSNQNGTVNFGGVVVNPGFEGGAGNVITITFQVRNPGTASISFSSGSVLADDGKGTNILTSMQNSEITLTSVSPPATGSGTKISNGLKISSNPQIADGSWYNLNKITFSWNLPTDADGVSYDLSNNPDYQLSKSSQGFATSTSYDLTQFSDGTWYFYIAFESGGVWSPVAMRALQLDRAPPEPFVIVEENQSLAVTTANPAFQWAATDKTSGIAYYQAKIGNGDWFNPANIAQGSTYVLPTQSPTPSRTLSVRAYNNAGNFREESMNFSVGGDCSSRSGGVTCFLGSFFARWWWLLVLVVAILLAMMFWFSYHAFAYRRVFRRELLDFRRELDRDMKRLEDRIDVGVKKGNEVDLRPSHLAEKKASLERAALHLESDVKEEIKKIDKFTDEKK